MQQKYPLFCNPVVGNLYPCAPKCTSCYGGACETSSLNFAKNFVQEGMTVLDIGAHVGMYSIALSPKVGSHGKIYAIEASPIPFTALQHNAEMYSSIIPINGAAWNNPCIVEIDTNHSTAGHYISLPDNHAVFETQQLQTVQAYALDDYFSDDFTVDFVKMDIEGAEYYALQGMRNILSRSASVGLIMEINIIAAKAWGIKVSDIFNFLEELSFQFVNGDKQYWVSCIDDSVGGNLHFIKSVKS